MILEAPSRGLARFSSGKLTGTAKSHSQPTKPIKGTILENENLTPCKRPWRKYRPTHQREKVFVMAKRNYKLYTQVGTSRNILERLLAVLDSGAGPNFIRESDLPRGVTRLRYGPLPKVDDANNNPIRMKGLPDLIVRLGSRLVKLEFIVCARLAAPLILGCDFMDRFVEAIYPRKKTVEMDDGTTIPITRKLA